MAEASDDVGRTLRAIAAVERGAPDDVVTQLRITAESVVAELAAGGSVTLACSAPDARLHALLADASGGPPPIPTPGSFPAEPLTAHRKWVEIIDDIGGWHPLLESMVPGLRVSSIRRGPASAEITVDDGRRYAVLAIPLDDGRIVAGLHDDLAARFSAGSRPLP